MTKQIIVPFGPQHPVLPEPIHLDLVLEDEKVVDAIPSIGYIHRGFEKLVEKREFTEYVYIAERTCGICSFIHGATYCQGIEQIMNEMRDLTTVFLHDDSIRHRLRNVGVISREDAYHLGAVGPTARGSGVAIDIRKLGYGAYDRLNVQVVTDSCGDCYSRCAVRAKELFTSTDLIRQAVKKIPDGPIDVKVTGTPDGEYFMRAEQPRGELVHYLKGNGTKFLARSRIRTPTLTNIPPLIKMLQGCDLADVPVIVLSIDPCISCTER